MNDPDVNDPAATEADQSVVVFSESTESPKRRRWPWLLALLILLAATIPAWLAVDAARNAATEQTGMQSQMQVLDERLQDLGRDLAQLRQTQERLSQRLDGSTATNQVLREELLGMGERAALLEDAVARLSQRGISGESILRINEAELLLSMGAERMAMYTDSMSALRAFELAEGILAGLDDPALATLRQTLAQELIQLQQMPPDPRPGLRAELAMLAQQLHSLPALHEGEEVFSNPEGSRWKELLSQWITVRRIDADANPLGPSQHQAALAAIALQLELAQAALTQPDEAAFHDILDRIDATATRLFDGDADNVKDWLTKLREARHTALHHEIPALGATLRELRNLRTVRQLSATTPPRTQAPVPASTPVQPTRQPVPISAEPTPSANDSESALESSSQQHDESGDPMPDTSIDDEMPPAEPESEPETEHEARP